MEDKFVIVRTYKNHVEGCYGFTTKNYNGGNIVPYFSSYHKVADEIKIKAHVGGALAIELISKQTNGVKEYPITETVYFDEGIVSAIDIYTYFDQCHSQKKMD